MRTVFLVDDEPVLHELYREVLSVNGFEVIGKALNGEEALKVYRELEVKPDIIILDHRMPKGDGLFVMGEILSLDPEAKVIFASADTSVRERVLRLGALGFLEKPFSINDLINVVSKGS